MGGRGIHAVNHNAQITLEQYMFRQRIKEIHNRWRDKQQEEVQVNTLVKDGESIKTAKKKTIALKRCACCRSFSIPAFTQYEICPICGWVDDPCQNRDPNLEEGSNPFSLNKARQRWKEKLKGNKEI